MTDRPITSADLEVRRPANTYQLTSCPKCGRQQAGGVLVRRLPEGTYHRNLADARAGRNAFTASPKCGAPLHQRNLAN